MNSRKIKSIIALHGHFPFMFNAPVPITQTVAEMDEADADINTAKTVVSTAQKEDPKLELIGDEEGHPLEPAMQQGLEDDAAIKKSAFA